MLIDFAVFIALIAAISALLSPRLRCSNIWRATVTPLASIIGSGFLVVGPILVTSFGWLAPAAMLALCAATWLFGIAIRYNIKAIGSDNSPRSPLIERVETFASWLLGLAYIVSIAYYLSLFGAFALSLTSLSNPENARYVTAALLIFIGLLGWLWGFKALEKFEYYSVAIKLSIIAAILCGLLPFFSGLAWNDSLYINPPATGGIEALFLLFGLIITVQGFETSRYLGNHYNVETRLKSMRLAQITSTIIYLIYVSLISFIFTAQSFVLTETASIEMMAQVSAILPPILVVAALAAQFSASLADMSGAGGLFNELTRGRLRVKDAFVLISLAGLVLIFVSDVFDIISYASRCFAAYYAVQSLIAALTAQEKKDTRLKIAGFYCLFVLGASAALFGVAVE